MKGIALVGSVGIVGALLLAFVLNSGKDSAPIDLHVVPETMPAAPATYEGEAVQWVSPALAPGAWPNRAVGKGLAQAAIRDLAAQLAKVDYPALALPGWVTETRALRIQSSDFAPAVADVWLDQRGTATNSRLELYGWRGPEFPQKPDRPVVHRWVQVYALFDVARGRVVSLFATVAGEAQE